MHPKLKTVFAKFSPVPATQYQFHPIYHPKAKACSFDTVVKAICKHVPEPPGKRLRGRKRRRHVGLVPFRRVPEGFSVNC